MDMGGYRFAHFCQTLVNLEKDLTVMPFKNLHEMTIDATLLNKPPFYSFSIHPASAFVTCYDV
jgi:hypothetical protein